MKIIHSLYVARSEDYDDPAELWAIVGEIPDDGYPSARLISSLDLASNTPFYGTSIEEFESHVTGLNSALQRDMDSNAHQASQPSDDGTREVFSRGLTLLPPEGAQAFLGLEGSIV